MPRGKVTEVQDKIGTLEGRSVLRIVTLTEFSGQYPDISLPEDIDLEELGPNPVFVTLPIGQVNAHSRNDRIYRDTAVMALVRQVNENRPEGMWGHYDPWEISFKYDPPGIRWLAAMIDDNGLAWGKGLALTPESENYYRKAKATNARVGTSILAFGEVDDEGNVLDLELITIDMADPARVGVPVTAARPKVTSEMLEGGDQSGATNPPPTPPPTPTPSPMPTPPPPSPTPPSGELGPGDPDDDEDDDEEIEGEGGANEEGEDDAEESPKVPEEEMKPKGNGSTETPVEENRDQVRADRDNLREQVDQLLPFQEQVNKIAKILGEGDVVELVQELVDTNTDLIDEAINSVVARECHVPSVRPTLARLARTHEPRNIEEVKAAVKKELASENVKSLISVEVQNSMGPNQSRPGSHRGGASGKFFEIPPRTPKDQQD